MTESPGLTVAAVAARFRVSPVVVIKALMKRGVMATVQQELDSATVTDLVAILGSGDEGGEEINGAGVPRPRPSPGLTGSAAVPLPDRDDSEGHPPDHGLVSLNPLELEL